MKHLRRFATGILAASILFCPTSSRAAERASAREISVRTLKNGMKILVWPDHDIPNVVVYNWFHVGSRNERPGITGLSHFFEHMMFKGSKNYPPGEFDRVMEQNGGANNAFTTEDVTCYQDWFPKSILDLVFRLEADRICCLSFDPKAVQSEREVVFSERRTSVDNDNASLLDEQLQAAAYVGHPYHNPVIGWPSDIERWTIADLQEYFRVHYAPNNATMIVAGDVTPEEVFALAEKHFGPIPRVEQPPEEITQEPPQIGERRVTLKKFGQTPLLEMAFHIGRGADKDAEARVLLVNILSAGESSRLYRRLVDQDRLAIDASAFQNPSGFDPGLLKIAVTVAPDKTLEAAEKATLEELAKIGESGVTEAELRKAKNAAQSGYWRQLETINAKAASLGSYQMMRGDYRALFTSPERFERVTRAEVQALAKTIFTEKNRTVGVLIPEKAEASR